MLRLSVMRTAAFAAGTTTGRLKPERICGFVASAWITDCFAHTSTRLPVAFDLRATQRLAALGVDGVLPPPFWPPLELDPLSVAPFVTTGESGGIGEATSLNVAPA